MVLMLNIVFYHILSSFIFLRALSLALRLTFREIERLTRIFSSPVLHFFVPQSAHQNCWIPSQTARLPSRWEGGIFLICFPSNLGAWGYTPSSSLPFKKIFLEFKPLIKGITVLKLDWLIGFHRLKGILSTIFLYDTDFTFIRRFLRGF